MEEKIGRRERGGQKGAKGEKGERNVKVKWNSVEDDEADYFFRANMNNLPFYTEHAGEE